MGPVAAMLEEVGTRLSARYAFDGRPCARCLKPHPWHPQRGWKTDHAYQPGDPAKPDVIVRAGYIGALFGALWACTRCGSLIAHELADLHDELHVHEGGAA